MCLLNRPIGMAVHKGRPQFFRNSGSGLYRYLNKLIWIFHCINTSSITKITKLRKIKFCEVSCDAIHNIHNNYIPATLKFAYTCEKITISTHFVAFYECLLNFEGHLIAALFTQKHPSHICKRYKITVPIWTQFTYTNRNLVTMLNTNN